MGRTLLNSLSVATALLITSCGESPAPPALVTTAPYDADSGTMLLKCGRLIDGLADDARQNVSVLIENGRISAVGGNLSVTDDISVLDLSDSTCMPGFIDTHTHIMEGSQDMNDLAGYYKHTEEYTLETGRKNAKITLDVGFTTVRNVGVYYGLSSGKLRDEINRGDVIGPRVQASLFYLTIPGGGGDLVIPGVPESEIPPHIRMGVARGPDEFRAKAQAAVDAGADVLKVIASGAVLAFGGVPGAPEMTEEEIRAVVEVAHAAGIKVTAHCHGAQSIKDSIAAGVDSIEHASYLDDEGIQMALANDVALSMDIFNGDYIAEVGRQENWPEEFLRKNDETALIQRQNFKKAHEAGVALTFGSDSAVYPHGMNGRQFKYMVEWGMSEMEAIQAATSVGAKYIGWGDKVGAIEVGRFGDIVAVKGNPLDDITILENIDTVVKGGLLFKHR